MAQFGFGQLTETLPTLPPGASAEQQLQVMNDIIFRINEINRILKALTRTQVLTDQTGTERMLFGYQEDGWGAGKSFGIKVSIEGVNVTEATDSELLFSMDLETWLWFDDNGTAHTLIGKDEGGF